MATRVGPRAKRVEFYALLALARQPNKPRHRRATICVEQMTRFKGFIVAPRVPIANRLECRAVTLGGRTATPQHGGRRRRGRQRGGSPPRGSSCGRGPRHQVLGRARHADMASRPFTNPSTGTSTARLPAAPPPSRTRVRRSAPSGLRSVGRRIFLRRDPRRRSRR